MSFAERNTIFNVGGHMSFEKWIEQEMPNQDAWARCQNLNKNSGAPLAYIQQIAHDVLENNSYPKEEMMDMVEAEINYSLIDKLQ